MPQPQRVAIWLSAVALMTAVSCSEAVGARVSDDFERSFTLGDGGTVTVTNTNGSVEVNAADGDRVLLRARKTARDAGALEAIAIQIADSPDRIDIKTKIPRKAKNASVSYELEVPRGAQVQATSVNGSIKINGTQGKTHATSVNGSVKIGEVSGSVTARTVNGSLQVRWDSLEGSAKNSLETVNGSLKVWMPGDVQGAFEANTVNGSIKTDLPLEVRKGKHSRQPSISDRIGENGAQFALATVNGSISILGN